MWDSWGISFTPAPQIIWKKAHLCRSPNPVCTTMYHYILSNNSCAVKYLYLNHIALLSANYLIFSEIIEANVNVSTWDAILFIASSCLLLISGVPGQLPPLRVPWEGCGCVRGSSSPSNTNIKGTGNYIALLHTFLNENTENLYCHRNTYHL